MVREGIKGGMQKDYRKCEQTETSSWSQLKKEKAIQCQNQIMIQQISIFFENLIAIEAKTTWMLLNKPVYLDLLILEISKTVKYELKYIKIFQK